jgi:hypothetical protein
MGFFSEMDIEVREMIADGATRKQVADSYPMLREDEIDMYFDGDFDDDDNYLDDGMDGDFDSAMASAGYGTDEDYGYCGDEY